MKMTDTQIVCPMCMVILNRARPDLVAYWLACKTIELKDQDQIPLGHVCDSVFFPLFSVIMLCFLLF